MYSNYDYSTVNSAAAGGVLGAVLAFLGIFIVIALAVAVVTIIAEWKLFTKAKQPGWASLIPFYNTYIMCKLAGVNPWWIVIVLCSSLISFIPIIGSLLCFAVSIYFSILLYVSVARAFGKEDGYAIGLILLPVVFLPILAFGKDEYKGANPMNDIVFKDYDGVNPKTSSTKKSADDKFCSSCGSKVDKKTKFCSNCGAEVK